MAKVVMSPKGMAMKFHGLAPGGTAPSRADVHVMILLMQTAEQILLGGGPSH
jgi:hypothetical protein